MPLEIERCWRARYFAQAIRLNSKMFFLTRIRGLCHTFFVPNSTHTASYRSWVDKWPALNTVLRGQRQCCVGTRPRTSSALLTCSMTLAVDSHLTERFFDETPTWR